MCLIIMVGIITNNEPLETSNSPRSIQEDHSHGPGLTVRVMREMRKRVSRGKSASSTLLPRLELQAATSLGIFISTTYMHIILLDIYIKRDGSSGHKAFRGYWRMRITA